MKVYLADDEPLAVKRLQRLLEATGRVELAGSSSDPAEAVRQLNAHPVDALFLDIEMPGMTGFELLSLLEFQPLVVFVTAYNQYALQAFEVNSVDYLLKPVEPPKLDRALARLDRILRGSEARPDLGPLIEQLKSAPGGDKPDHPRRLASRLGERVEFIELVKVTHIFAKDKLTFAATGDRNHCIDQTIAELETKLNPKRFVRIHRATIVNVDFVHELHPWLAVRMLVRLKDDKQTELTVARDRVKELKERLGI